MSRTAIGEKVLQEPYRLFFPLGILIALIGVGHWPVYSMGWSRHYSAFFHSAIQTQSYMVCFIVGFLMTAMPKFSSAAHAKPRELLLFLGLILGNTAALSLGEWITAELCFAGVLISLLGFVKKRISARSHASAAPLEFVWIPIGIFHGLAGALLMVLTQLGIVSAAWFPAAKLMSEQGFVLCVVIGVGGFLAPRLMGTFRVFNKPGQLPGSPELAKIRRRVLFFHLVSGVLIFASFVVGTRHKDFSYFLRAAVITAEYFWSCSYLRPPRTPDFYAKLVWVSLWMIVAGSWGAALFAPYRTAMLHLIFIGGFSLMIFSVATMVVLSHGGESEKLRRPLPVLWFSVLGVAGSLASRLAAPFFPEHYFFLIGLAGILWSGIAVLWFFFALPKIFRGMSGEELEKCHEDAKQRVAQLRGEAPSTARRDGQCCEHKKSACE